jgi:hypothetical protein
LKEREKAVMKQKMELDRETRGKRNLLRHEETVTLFQSLLVDNIKSHEVRLTRFVLVCVFLNAFFY